MLEVILTILGAVLVYLFGRWQGEHQLLYQRRAEVLDELFDRFEDVDQKFYTLFNWYDLGEEPDKLQKAKLAAESFNALQGYYRRNSIWLPLRASAQFSDFLARYRGPFYEFTSAVIAEDRPPGRIEKWVEVWTAFKKESPEIRQTLETEFRAALGSWRAKLVILLGLIRATRRDEESASGAKRP